MKEEKYYLYVNNRLIKVFRYRENAMDWAFKKGLLVYTIVVQ